MADIEFQVVINLKATINTGPIDQAEKSNEKKKLIQRFLQEFLKYKVAVLSFYRCAFLDEYIDGAAPGWQVLAKDLYYLPDYGPLFMEIAKNCPKNVARFIESIYGYEGPNQKANIERTLNRKSLEAELRSLMVVDASFKRISQNKETVPNP